MHCISSSKLCEVGNGDHYHGQPKMATQPELVTRMFLWSTFTSLSLIINFATVPWKSHCGLCPAQAVGRGAWPWLHTLLPFAPLSITRGTKINAKLLFCTKLSLPRGKARLWGSVCLKMGHAGGCFPQPSSPQCSCTAGGEAILLLASGHDREKLQHRTSAPAPGSCQRPPRSRGCQGKCQNQSGLGGRFTSPLDGN